MRGVPVQLLKTGLLLLASAAAAAVAPADELKLAHFMPPTHTLHQEVFQPLADALGEATGGALTLRIHPADALGKGPIQQYKQAVEGVAPQVPLATIFQGIWPFWLAMLLCLAILVTFPELALFLPERMF